MQAELRAACQPPAEVSSLRAAVKHVVAWLGLHASLVQAPQLQEVLFGVSYRPSFLALPCLQSRVGASFDAFVRSSLSHAIHAL